MSKEMKTLTINGLSYEIVDEKARERLGNVEYLTEVDDLAYLHDNLPEGEKTVTINGDGTFGNLAYASAGKDLISRNTYNQKFPYKGITLTRNDMVYHAEGTTGDEKSIIYFCESSSRGASTIDKEYRGKILKMLSFSNAIHGLDVVLSLQFADEEGKTLSFLNSAGASKTSEGIYVGKKAINSSTTVTIPDNAAFVRAYISFPANATYDFDFQVYFLIDELTTATPVNVPTTIENVGDTLITVPYKSVVNTKSPIKDYIQYMSANSKGDPATYLTPEAFGAIGDGYADDSQAIAQCLAKSVETNQTVIMAKKYLITTPLDIAHDGLDVIANEIVYSGTDTALKIRGMHNSLKIHSITSEGVGITFSDDNGKFVRNNDITINSIIAKSHGVTFYNGVKGICQNTIRFSYIKAGGDGCYGICGLIMEGQAWVSENSFYGGQITNCDWAVYGVGGNSKFYGIQVEGYVKGCFYSVRDGMIIFHPRIAEAQIDGTLPSYKFTKTNHCHIYDSSGIYLNQIDLSDAVDTFEVAGATHPIPLHEYQFGTINGRIIGRNAEDGKGSNCPVVYTTKAYLWGKFLIMTPHMAYRKVITTEELDTRNIGKETSDKEVQALSQLPTKFVVDNIDSEIHLHESYCAFGFNEFEVEQANGFTCKVYDKLDNLIFDGTELGDGVYKFKVYKDADKCMARSVGMLRRDFLGHYWEITKETTVNDVLNALPTWSGGVY